jgi:alpha-ketoglutarate-dependent taurine dioxygenase
MAIEVHHLSERIGSEVRAHPDELQDPATAREVRRLLKERGVLVFRELHLTDAQQVGLARGMGTLREEGRDFIQKITLDKALNTSADYLKGSFNWHMDGTHDDVPVFASLLSGRKLSDSGGQTLFANSYAAYEALPAETRERLEGLKAVHSVEVSMRRGGVEATPAYVAHWRSMPDRAHNLVWKHADGRKSLVIGCHASHVDGMDFDEGRALLEDLLAWATRPQFTYRHEWSVGDMLIWDNTGVLHRVEPYALDSGRVMHRTTLLGEEAFA